MADGGYVLLDTKAFDAVIDQKDSLVQRYDKINTMYDEIVNTLQQHSKTTPITLRQISAVFTTFSK